MLAARFSIRSRRNPQSLNYIIMEKFREFAKIISAITLMAFLASCAQSADGRNTQAQGTAIGAVGGAALGALIGYAAGGGQGAARGAIAGGAVGGVAGFAYGTHVAHQKAKYASTERWLDSCIASARRANARAYAYNHSLGQRIAALERRTRAAVAARDQAAARQIRGEIAGLKQEASAQQQQVDHEIAAQQGVSSDKSAHSSANYGEYNHQMGELRQTRAGMSRNINHLASLENQVNL